MRFRSSGKKTLRPWVARGVFLMLMTVPCACTTTVSSHKGDFGNTRPVEIAENQEETKSRIADLPYSELIGKGNEYLRKENFQLARLHFSVALKKMPDSVDALVGLGIIAFRENNFSEAGRLCNLALEKNPKTPQAMLYLGKIAREQGDLTSSLQWLNKAAELNPQDPQTLTELAITNDTIGQEHLAYAEPLYRKVVELRPKMAAAHNNLGFNLLLQGRYLEAIESFGKALVIDRHNMRTKNNLATAYLLNNEKDKALALYEGAVGKAAAYNNLGYIYMTQGKWDQAEKAFKMALSINPVFYDKAQQNLERLNNLRAESAP